MYYLLGTFDHDDECVDFIEALDAGELEEAQTEALHRLVDMSLDSTDDFHWANAVQTEVIEVTERTPVEIEQVMGLALAAKARRQETADAWQRTYEELRDELGHWRTLHARGQCPKAQVTVQEDRLQAHLTAKP